jgi:hypothetical protein
MDDAIVADSAMDAVDAMEVPVGGLQIDCDPDQDNDLENLSLEGNSTPVVAAPAAEDVGPDPGSTYSEVQLSHIKEMNDYLAATILIGSIHSSAKELKDIVNEYGSKQGFQVSTASHHPKCLLAGEPKKNQKRRELAASVVPAEKRRSRSSPRCGCGFFVKYSDIKTAIVTGNVIATNAPKQIKVTAVNFNHSNGCYPNAPQLLLVNKMTGLYTRNVDWTRVFKLLSHGIHVPAPLLRKEIQLLVPSGVAVDAIMLYNIRMKHKRMTEDGFDFTTATNVCFDPDSLSNSDSDMIDLGTKHAAELLKESLGEGSDGANAEKFLMSLKKEDSRFDYRIAKDKFGATCGYCWQTPTMRADLEQYGDVLFLDAMKRQQNSVYWPYIGPVVIDGDKKVLVVAESIVCTERLESYHFVLESVFSMSPGFDKSSIRMIFGDGIMGQSLLERLGIASTCHLGYDAYHLFNKDWPDHFGKLWHRVQDNFQGLLYAADQEQFDNHIVEIKGHLVAHPRHLDYLQREVLDHQRNFASHHIRAVKGKLLCGAVCNRDPRLWVSLV